MPGFGRIYQPDPRDDLYRMANFVDLSLALPPYKFWPCREADNQGNTPECVGFSWRNWLQAAPVMVKIGVGLTGDQIYDQAQPLDGIPMPHDGSTVRAGAQVLQKAGNIVSYVWAKDVATIKAFVCQSGPIVVGSDWYSGQMNPDSNNFVHVSGSVVGGHAYCLVGWSSVRSAFRILNSWGRGWGQNGRAWISEADFTRLFNGGAGSEACTAVEQAI